MTIARAHSIAGARSCGGVFRQSARQRRRISTHCDDDPPSHPSIAILVFDFAVPASAVPYRTHPLYRGVVRQRFAGLAELCSAEPFQVLQTAFSQLSRKTNILVSRLSVSASRSTKAPSFSHFAMSGLTL